MLYSTGAARGPVALTPTLSQGEREKPERSSATGWSGFAREDMEAVLSVQRGVLVFIIFVLLAVVVCCSLVQNAKHNPLWLMLLVVVVNTT